MIQKVFGLPGSLKELTKSMSHREYLTRLAWIELNYDDPDRSDYYQMQTAQEIRRSVSKKPKNIRLKDFLMKFRVKKQLSPEERLTRSKQAWYGALKAFKDKQDGCR